jgi:hypothetical protein
MDGFRLLQRRLDFIVWFRGKLIASRKDRQGREGNRV